jgi:hypothetical protein
VGTARVGLTQKEDHERGIDQEHVFDRVGLFLAALIARLLSRILGALEAPFGPIVANRGAAAAGAAAAGSSHTLGGSAVGLTMVVASAAVTPRRLASSVTHRVGASPSARSVARRTTRRT